MKHVFAVVGLVAISTASWACDVCGCSMSTVSGAFMSMQNAHFIGLKYNTRSFNSTHPTLFAGEQPVVSNEQFQSLELRGRFTPVRFLQFTGIVPMNHFVRKEEVVITTSTGVGDVALLGNVVFFSRIDSGRFDHRLSFGGGVKLPTGKSQTMSEEGQIFIPSMQPGTGSIDYLANISYMMRWMTWGLSTHLNARHNGVNKQHYQFGNRFGAEALVFRLFNVGQGGLQLRPFAGASYEFSEQDNQNTRIGSLNEYSGGTMVDAKAGLLFFKNQWMASMRMAHPLYQTLGASHIEAKTQFSIQINYLIKTK
ncbi:MAG: hypothetical protein R2813_00825 [Flavobacteriales bacterium]